jgi:hypothetical protein
VAIIQPYVGKAFVEKIERLRVEREGKLGEFEPVAIRVTLAGGQKDTFIYTGDSSVAVRCEGIELQGHFAYWSEVGGKLRCLHLVNGRRLLKDGVGVSDAPAPFRARMAVIRLSITQMLRLACPADDGRATILRSKRGVVS